MENLEFKGTKGGWVLCVENIECFAISHKYRIEDIDKEQKKIKLTDDSYGSNWVNFDSKYFIIAPNERLYIDKGDWVIYTGESNGLLIRGKKYEVVSAISAACSELFGIVNENKDSAFFHFNNRDFTKFNKDSRGGQDDRKTT
jgi:hypothetical protein